MTLTTRRCGRSPTGPIFGDDVPVAAKDPTADYRVRIFTPKRELPFAGHPTLGTCHVWLALGGEPKAEHEVQECGAGLVRDQARRRRGSRLPHRR